MAEAKAKEMEEKTNAWLLKVHKRNEWRAMHPKPKRVGWIQPREGYVPLCSGNSTEDWGAFLLAR